MAGIERVWAVLKGTIRAGGFFCTFLPPGETVMLAALTNLPMDGAVGVALVSMFVSFSMSLFGLLRNVKPAKRRMERNHD